MGRRGAVAQLVEHRLCKPGVVGSNPIRSTKRHYTSPSRLRSFRCPGQKECFSS